MAKANPLEKLLELGTIINNFARKNSNGGSGARTNKSSKKKSESAQNGSNNKGSTNKKSWFSKMDKIAMFSSVFAALDLVSLIQYIAQYIAAKRLIAKATGPSEKTLARNELKKAAKPLKKRLGELSELIATYGGVKARFARFTVLTAVRIAKKQAKRAKRRMKLNEGNYFSKIETDMLEDFFDYFFAINKGGRISPPKPMNRSRLQGENYFEAFIRRSNSRMHDARANDKDYKGYQASKLNSNQVIVFMLTTWVNRYVFLVHFEDENEITNKQRHLLSELHKLMQEGSELTKFLEDDIIDDDEIANFNTLGNSMKADSDELMQTILIYLERVEGLRTNASAFRTKIKIPVADIKIPGYYDRDANAKAAHTLSIKYNISPDEYESIKGLIHEAQK